MLNHISRLIGGFCLSVLSLGIVSSRLNAGSIDLSSRIELILLLTLWLAITGSVLGALVYYDVRHSLRYFRRGVISHETLDANEPRREINV